MIKKITILIACISFISFNLHAQKDIKAFKHLSVGLEVGTTGVGLEVATPVHPNITLRAGFAMFPFTYSTSFDIDVSEDLRDLNKYTEFPIDNNRTIGDALRAEGLPTDFSQLDTSADMDAKLGLVNGKILVDIYPSRKSSFHFVAGLYIGKSKLVNVDGYIPKDIVNVTRVLDEYSSYIPEGTGYSNLDFTSGIVIGDYTIKADENGKVDAGIKINGIKPYLGIGFGRAVPKKRVGCQFELGAMFHGTPKIVSSGNSDVIEQMQNDLDTSGFTDIMNKITVYPVLSFRIVGRIF